MQHQIGCRKQGHTTAVDARNIDAVAVAQAQRAEAFAVDFGARDQDTAREKLAVDLVPIDVATVPIGLLALAKKHRQHLRIALRRRHQQSVAKLDGRLAVGYRHLALAPHARNHELNIAQLGNLRQRLASNCLIINHKGGDVGRIDVLGVGCGEVLLTRKKLANDDDRQDHSHNTQRVGHRATQRRAIGRHAQLRQRLLRRTECGSIGRCTAQDTHHIGQRNGGDEGQSDGHCRADQCDT